MQPSIGVRHWRKSKQPPPYSSHLLPSQPQPGPQAVSAAQPLPIPLVSPCEQGLRLGGCRKFQIRVGADRPSPPELRHSPPPAPTRIAALGARSEPGRAPSAARARRRQRRGGRRDSCPVNPKCVDFSTTFGIGKFRIGNVGGGAVAGGGLVPCLACHQSRRLTRPWGGRRLPRPADAVLRRAEGEAGGLRSSRRHDAKTYGGCRCSEVDPSGPVVVERPHG